MRTDGGLIDCFAEETEEQNTKNSNQNPECPILLRGWGTGGGIAG